MLHESTHLTFKDVATDLQLTSPVEQVMERGCLPQLLSTCRQAPPEVQAAALHCLALLSEAQGAKAALADAGGLELGVQAAGSSSLVWQQHAAALLENLCSDWVTLQAVAVHPQGVPALVELAQHPDRIVQVCSR